MHIYPPLSNLPPLPQPLPSLPIDQTYCIPLRDIRLGFQTSKLHIQLDKENILITLYHPARLIELEEEHKRRKEIEEGRKEEETQTEISTQLERFVYLEEVRRVELEKIENGVGTTQHIPNPSDPNNPPNSKDTDIPHIPYTSHPLNSHCTTLIQTMLTGKLMDSFQKSTQLYIKSLESKINQTLQHQQSLLPSSSKSPFLKKKEPTPHSSPILSRFDSISTQLTMEEIEKLNSRVYELEQELGENKRVMESVYEDNVALIEIKKEYERKFKVTEEQNIKLHSEVYRVICENERLRKREGGEEEGSPVKERDREREEGESGRLRKKISGGSSGNGNSMKNSLHEVKLVQLSALQEENQILREYIETMKEKSKGELLLIQSRNSKIADSNSQRIQQNDKIINELSAENNHLKQRQSFLLTKIHQIQQTHNISIEIGQPQPFQASHQLLLNPKQKQLQQKILLLHKEIVTEKQYSNLLRIQNQNMITDMKKTIAFGEEEYTKLNYKRLVEMHEEQAKEMRGMETVIVGLKEVIREYQGIIDIRCQEEQEEQNEEEGEEANPNNPTSLETLSYLSELISHQLVHLNDLILSSHTRQSTTFPQDHPQLLHQLKKQHNKRILLQNKLQRLSHTLMEYQEEILEKTARISDLNYTILQYQEKERWESEMEIEGGEGVSFEEEYSLESYRGGSIPRGGFSHTYSGGGNGNGDGGFREERYKTVKDFRKTKYDQTPIEHNASQQDTITESRIREQLQHESQGENNRIKTKSKTGNTQSNNNKPVNKTSVIINNPNKTPSFNTNPKLLSPKQQQHSLKTIVTREYLSTKQKLSLILQIIETVEKNVSLWRSQLTPFNILITRAPQHHPSIRIDLSLTPPNTLAPLLYSSPQQLYQSKTQNSIVWRLATIFDELIHGSLFFETMQEIADIKILYKFRAKEEEMEGVRKWLGKAMVKNSSLRVGMIKFLAGVKGELRGK